MLIFFLPFWEHASDLRVIFRPYLSLQTPGHIANCIYLTRKSLPDKDLSEQADNGHTNDHIHSAYHDMQSTLGSDRGSDQLIREKQGCCSLKLAVFFLFSLCIALLGKLGSNNATILLFLCYIRFALAFLSWMTQFCIVLWKYLTWIALLGSWEG